MDTIRLRTMNEKSVITYGKYKDLRVGTVLKIDIPYLAWMYYQFDAITFVPEILEKIQVTGDLVIDKPGEAATKIRAWWFVRKKGMSEIEVMAHASLVGGLRRRKARRTEAEIVNVSKGRMVALNHKKGGKRERYT